MQEFELGSDECNHTLQVLLLRARAGKPVAIQAEPVNTIHRELTSLAISMEISGLSIVIPKSRTEVWVVPTSFKEKINGQPSGRTPAKGDAQSIRE